MNKFSFNRFKKVVVYDFHNTLSLYGFSMLILMLIPVAIWTLGWVFHPLNENFEVPPTMRLWVVYLMTTLAAALAPLKIYKSCNLRGTGNYFAMLPASLGEKFWSMFLYSFILAPLAVFLGSAVVDTVLFVFPFGPFDSPIWDASLFGSRIDYSYYDGTTIPFFYGGYALLSCVLSVFSTASVFFFTNTIFKKNKFIKTILWSMLIGFVLTNILLPIFIHNAPRFIEWLSNHMYDPEPYRFFTNTYWVSIAFSALLTAIFSFFTFRRLKKMQY